MKGNALITSINARVHTFFKTIVRKRFHRDTSSFMRPPQNNVSLGCALCDAVTSRTPVPLTPSLTHPGALLRHSAIDPHSTGPTPLSGQFWL